MDHTFSGDELAALTYFAILISTGLSFSAPIAAGVDMLD